MSKIKAKIDVVASVDVHLTEKEARALWAITCYGDDKFIEVFYSHLGKAYLQPYELDLRNLFNHIFNTFPKILGKADTARKESAICEL